MGSISFNPIMLAAVLAGRKTVTRRRLALELPGQPAPGRYHCRGLSESGALFEDSENPAGGVFPVACPFGQAGALLRLQEAPEHQLRVTGIRVEQVQSITENEAQREGIRCRQQPRGGLQWGGVAPDPRAADGLQWHSSAVGAFRGLFDSIYPMAWARNEWVWVIEFALVPKAGG